MSNIVEIRDASPARVELIGGPGVPGAPGKSAYEIAVDNDFVGTEAEWLASLQGEPGPAGGSYRHVQGVAASTWDITHNLGYLANWRVVDSAGEPAYGHVVDVDLNRTLISFTKAGVPVAFAGEAYGT